MNQIQLSFNNNHTCFTKTEQKNKLGEFEDKMHSNGFYYTKDKSNKECYFVEIRAVRL